MSIDSKGRCRAAKGESNDAFAATNAANRGQQNRRTAGASPTEGLS
jgi:hypothetical protein